MASALSYNSVAELLISRTLEERESSKLVDAKHKATLVACGWAWAVMEKVTEAFEQEQ